MPCCFLICATGLPGVLFVLPDSYVDPEFKDYGGSFLLLLLIWVLVKIFTVSCFMSDFGWFSVVYSVYLVYFHHLC
jgi:hypothetical protein